MAANWKKILFEGSDIDVSSIIASGLEELTADSPGVNSLPVLSYTTNDGIFKQIAQSGLNQAVGSTLFTVSGSDDTSNTSFNAAGHKLIITTSNPTYFGAALTSTSDTTTITFTPSADFVTGSGQINIISASSLNAPTANTDFAFGNLNLGVGQSAGDAPTKALNSLGGDYLTTIYPLLLRRSNNVTTISDHVKKVDPDATAQQQDLPASSTGVDQWRIFSNLWINKYSTSPQSTANVSQLNSDAPIVGRHSVYWLSASFLGGFSDGTPSLSASFSEFTGSIFSISSSVSNLGISASALNNFTGSDNGGALLQANTESIVTSFSSDTVFSIEEQLNVNQITFFDTDEDGNTLDQGKRIALGTPTTDPDISSIDLDARDLTIGANSNGTLTADSYGLGFGMEFQQINIQRINGGINFGTSSLHTHRFHGNTFITGGIIVTGGLHWGGQTTHGDEFLPEQHNTAILDGTPIQVLVANDNGEFGYAFVSGSGNLAAVITGSANEVITQFETDIAAIQSIIGDASTDASNIDDLEDGFTNNSDSLQNLYEKGIFFATSSGDDGFKVTPLETASFSATEIEGTDVLTTSYVSNKVRYTFFPNRFANAALTDVDGRVYTSSVAISQSAASLNRYAEDGTGVLTGSNAESATNFATSYTAADLLYIQNLAEDLSGAPAGTQFITGAGEFSDLLNFPGVNEFNSPSQGVAEFSLQGTYKFGATGSKMGPGDDPQFNNLTVDGDLTVEGTLTQVNKANLNISDQFILINSGAKPAFGQAPSDNDQDGGIIVGQGDLSGSLLMYDFTQRSWGFLGSQPADNIALDAESFNGNPLIPETTIRVILHAVGTPPTDINDVKYGISTGDKQRGIMYCDTTPGSEDVYIYA